MKTKSIPCLITITCLCFGPAYAQAPNGTPATVGRGGGGVGRAPSAGIASAAQNLTLANQAVATANRMVATVSSSYRDGVPPVQIRFSPVDSKVSQEMEEDLGVMGYLVDQAIDEPQSAMGIEMVITSGSRSVRGMYVEGVGALYMVKVNFPVLGNDLPEDKPEEKAATSEWEKAREALRGQGPGPQTEGYASRTSVHYDPKQIDALKKILVATMKNGANFRHLKPEEYLSFAVFGHPSPVRALVSQPKSTSNYVAGQNNKNGYAITWSNSKGADQGTVLTLKARKSDVDAFANGSLDLDAFSKKVTTTAYAGNGYGVTSVNSWVRDSRGYGLQVR